MHPKFGPVHCLCARTELQKKYPSEYYSLSPVWDTRLRRHLKKDMAVTNGLFVPVRIADNTRIEGHIEDIKNHITGAFSGLFAIKGFLIPPIEFVTGQGLFNARISRIDQSREIVGFGDDVLDHLPFLIVVLSNNDAKNRRIGEYILSVLSERSHKGQRTFVILNNIQLVDVSEKYSSELMTYLKDFKYFQAI